MPRPLSACLALARSSSRSEVARICLAESGIGRFKFDDRDALIVQRGVGFSVIFRLKRADQFSGFGVVASVFKFFHQRKALNFAPPISLTFHHDT